MNQGASIPTFLNLLCPFLLQGIKNLSTEQADHLAGTDPDYATRDLSNAIKRGEYPSWTFYVQVFYSVLVLWLLVSVEQQFSGFISYRSTVSAECYLGCPLMSRVSCRCRLVVSVSPLHREALGWTEHGPGSSVSKKESPEAFRKSSVCAKSTTSSLMLFSCLRK